MSTIIRFADRRVLARQRHESKGTAPPNPWGDPRLAKAMADFEATVRSAAQRRQDVWVLVDAYAGTLLQAERDAGAATAAEARREAVRVPRRPRSVSLRAARSRRSARRRDPDFSQRGIVGGAPVRSAARRVAAVAGTRGAVGR